MLNAEDQAYSASQAYDQLYKTFLPIHMLNYVDSIKSLLYDNDKNSTTISTGELSTFFDTFNLNATTADYYACSKDCLNNKEITFTNGFPCYNDGESLISLTPNGYTDYNLPKDAEDCWVDLYQSNITLEDRNLKTPLHPAR